MGEISFIHLSDIHFRRTSGNSYDIDRDLRNAVLMDIKYNLKKDVGNVNGILLGGDIAFAGQEDEYRIANSFLKEIAVSMGKGECNIYCVPGNHDVDQGMGIKAQWVKPWTITTKDSDFSSELQNILDEQFNPERPNAVWCSDITYIWTIDGFVYLTSIMDLYSRKIIAWTLSKTLEVSCVIETINKAKARRKIEEPLILHSDRGSQYVSKEYKRITAGIQCSYSKKAYPWDNACIESFHSLIKREWLNRFKIRDYDHAYRLVFEYLEAFYNTKRIHSHCDYMSPNDYEELYRRIQKDELLMAS